MFRFKGNGCFGISFWGVKEIEIFFRRGAYHSCQRFRCGGEVAEFQWFRDPPVALRLVCCSGFVNVVMVTLAKFCFQFVHYWPEELLRC